MERAMLLPIRGKLLRPQRQDVDYRLSYRLSPATRAEKLRLARIIVSVAMKFQDGGVSRG